MKYWRTSAAAPAAMGAAYDVPPPPPVPQLTLPPTVPLVLADVLYPGAIRSGLMRPSDDQPREEKSDMFSSLVDALLVRVLPTQRPFLLVDGLPMENSTLFEPLKP